MVSYIVDDKMASDKTFYYQMNKGNFHVEEYWMALRNVCTSTPGKRIERGKPKSLQEPEVQRPDIFR